MNQLTYGQKINPPISIVRSVSFEKIRQGSLSSPSSKSNNNPKIQFISNPINLCQRLISNKLIINQPHLLSPSFQTKSIDTIQSNKLILLKKQLEQKQMKQCTFKPKINNSNQPLRTLEQFIYHQQIYQKNKSDKVNQMRQIIKAQTDKQNTFQPILIKNNTNQYSRKPTGPVYQRLYQQSTKRSQSKQSTPQTLQKPHNPPSAPKPQPTTFSRKPSQKSIGKTCPLSKQTLHLHHYPQQFNQNLQQTSKQISQPKPQQQISSRRQYSRSQSNRSHSHQKGLKITKYMDVQQLCQKKLNNKKILQQRQLKKLTSKNKQIYIKKVLRQISSILLQLTITDLNLTYIQMTQILQKMNFIDDQTNINDRKYLYQIWQMLQGDLYQTCPLTNLIKIIFSLLGCYDTHIIDECLTRTIQDQPSTKKLVLTQKQSKNIKTNFEQLALNRLKKGQYNTNQPKTQQYSFKPFISKNSVQMAEKYRQKVLQQSQKLMNDNLIQFQVGQSGQVGHVDLLLLDDKRKQLKMKLKRQQQQRQRIRLQDQSMQVDKPKKPKQKYFQSSQSTSLKSQHTHDFPKPTPTIPTQKLLDIKDLPKQCTFNPNLPRSKQNTYQRLISKQSKQNSLYNSINQLLTKPQQSIKDIDQSIQRLSTNRIQDYQQINYKQQPINKYTNEQPQQSKQDSPLLYLNINMSGYEDVKVSVYHNDNMKTITKKVKILSGIQYGQDHKLQQFLKRQIMPTLKSIGMNLDTQ